MREMTPLRRPERLAPGKAEAEMAGAMMGVDAPGAVEETGAGPEREMGRGVIGDGGTRTVGWMAGVEGPEDAGEGVSTIHMRCERVATSLATVWASVLKGLT